METSWAFVPCPGREVERSWPAGDTGSVPTAAKVAAAQTVGWWPARRPGLTLTLGKRQVAQPPGRHYPGRDERCCRGLQDAGCGRLFGGRFRDCTLLRLISPLREDVIVVGLLPRLVRPPGDPRSEVSPHENRGHSPSLPCGPATWLARPARLATL